MWPPVAKKWVKNMKSQAAGKRNLSASKMHLWDMLVSGGILTPGPGN